MHYLPLLEHPLVQYYLTVILCKIPVMRILERMGLKVWWTLLLAVPMVGFVLVMTVMACKRWPTKPDVPAKGDAA